MFFKACAYDEELRNLLGQISQPMKSLLVEKGHKDVIGLLIKASANKDAQDKYGQTALHRAAQEGNEEVVKVLLKAGIAAEVVGKNGLTPLHLAAGKGHHSVVSELLTAGANENTPTSTGKTPLHFAALQGHGTVVTKLLEGFSVSGDIVDKINTEIKTTGHLFT